MKSIITFGGLLLLSIYLSIGNIALYLKGNVNSNFLNLSTFPYFSFIGNLGNSNKSFVSSATPECWPNAYLKFKSSTIFLNSKLYSPKG